MNQILKRPSAYLPIIMSLAALAMLITYLLMFGVRHETDEGTAAHIFQLLMGGQLPIIAFFALKWFPQKPRETLHVLALQLFAGLAAFAPVFYFRL
jgi:hypothetical protein